MAEIYNYNTNQFEYEEEYKESLLYFLYNTFIGRFLLKLIFARPYFSKLRAIYLKSKFSKKKINEYIEKYNIDMSEYNNQDYSSFNDFFIRKRCIYNKSKEKDLVSIADAKLMAYKIKPNLKLKVKNGTYSLNELLGNKMEAQIYKDGYCLIFRLSYSDYHRYSFLDDGVYIKQEHIKGMLHTIRPISDETNSYIQNTRVINILSTKNFGRIAQVEVGAMLVGCIENNNLLCFKKLEEKGHFEFGGSTILLFINNVKINNIILDNSKRNIETKVKIGDIIGEKIC